MILLHSDDPTIQEFSSNKLNDQTKLLASTSDYTDFNTIATAQDETLASQISFSEPQLSSTKAGKIQISYN